MATTAPGSRAAAAPHDTAFFGHPKGLSTLFFTEMWERFAYYGMRAILILFMTASVASGGLGFDVGKAGAVYGTYVALVYMLSLPGGWVADKILGLRKSVLIGGVLIMLGQLSLAVPGAKLFYLGLALIILGTGLLKPNVSAIVGELYGKEDVRRDAGFSIFYMGIN
ncbi:MAG: oligopeptide:H+ symporter, partial [Gemmatimonadales bacterium]|nr:oligopeptide:H+ symporter [Gemmatimonadales bacterium]